MKTYEIAYKETYRGYYSVQVPDEATRNDAVKEFYHLAGEGKIDFSDMTMTDSSITCISLTEVD